jgi:hypothetical protein
MRFKPDCGHNFKNALVATPNEATALAAVESLQGASLFDGKLRIRMYDVQKQETLQQRRERAPPLNYGWTGTKDPDPLRALT